MNLKTRLNKLEQSKGVVTSYALIETRDVDGDKVLILDGAEVELESVKSKYKHISIMPMKKDEL